MPVTHSRVREHCKLSELDSWYWENKVLPPIQRKPFVISDSMRVTIGKSGTALVFKSSNPLPFVVKLLQGSSHKDYDHYGKSLDGARTSFGTASLDERSLVRAIQKGAFWLVIDEN